LEKCGQQISKLNVIKIFGNLEEQVNYLNTKVPPGVVGLIVPK